MPLVLEPDPSDLDTFPSDKPLSSRLLKAAEDGDVTEYQNLRNIGADYRTTCLNGATVFHLAAKNCQIGMLRHLSTQNAEMTIKASTTKAGVTPIMYVLMNDQTDVTEKINTIECLVDELKMSLFHMDKMGWDAKAYSEFYNLEDVITSYLENKQTELLNTSFGRLQFSEAHRIHEERSQPVNKQKLGR